MHLTLGILAGLFGLYFAFCEVTGTYEFLITDQGGFNYIVAAGCGIAAALSLLPVWAAMAWRERVWLSIVLWVMFFAALGTVVVAGIARTGTAVDQRQDTRTDSAVSAAKAKNELSTAEAAAQRADEAVTAARRDMISEAAKPGCKDRCVGLLEAALSSAEAGQKAAYQRRDAASAAVAAIPPARKDPLARRLATIFWVEEDTIRKFQPLSVPVLTSMLAAALFAFATHCFAPFRRRGETGRAIPATRADLRETRAPQTLPPAQLGLALGHGESGDSLAPFAQRHFKPRGGVRVSMKDVAKLYEEECRQANMQALDRGAFARELAALCKRTNIPVRVEGRDVYLMGVALA